MQDSNRLEPSASTEAIVYGVRSEERAKAKATVNQMHNDMKEVESWILTLERENAHLKMALLTQRARVLEKYFLGTDTNLQQAVITAWRRASKQMQRYREVDSAHALRAEDA